MQDQSQNQSKLSNKRVAIVATDGFEESELLEPKHALEAAGAQVDVIAPKAGSNSRLGRAGLGAKPSPSIAPSIPSTPTTTTPSSCRAAS